MVTQYPDPSSNPNEGPIIDHYELVETHAGNVSHVSIGYGGTGQRRIQFIFEMRAVKFCTLQIFIYGYDTLYSN